jgi:hypothetical protein
MFGIERVKHWYDLTSAYKTVMSMAGHTHLGAMPRLTSKIKRMKSRRNFV